MSGYIQERYKPMSVGVNATVLNPSSGVGGFIAITTGTLTIKKNNAAQDIIVNAVPVTAGVYLPLPIFVSDLGMLVTTAGGASGVLCTD